MTNGRLPKLGCPILPSQVNTYVSVKVGKTQILKTK